MRFEFLFFCSLHVCFLVLGHTNWLKSFFFKGEVNLVALLTAQNLGEQPNDSRPLIQEIAIEEKALLDDGDKSGLFW